MPKTIAFIHGVDGKYGISFPEFPGCISGGRTVEETLRRGAEALNFHVAGMVEDGDPLPDPMPFEKLREAYADELSDGAVSLVQYDVPGRSLRINISIEESLLAQIDSAAESFGQSRSAFLADAARSRLARSSSAVKAAASSGRIVSKVIGRPRVRFLAKKKA